MRNKEYEIYFKTNVLITEVTSREIVTILKPLNCIVRVDKLNDR